MHPTRRFRTLPPVLRAGRVGRAALLIVIAGSLAGCGSAGRKPMESVDRGWKQTGVASWYGADFHGRRTANGEIYDMYGMTAAHKTLPFDTLVEVENLDNGRKVRVRINDRGPFVRGRVIDLTYTAAEEIAMIGPGVAKVRLRVLGAVEVEGRIFVVQVGAFTDPTLARERERELRRRYDKVRIASDGGYHRVLVGRFEKRKKADRLARRLERDGYETVVRADLDA